MVFGSREQGVAWVFPGLPISFRFKMRGFGEAGGSRRVLINTYIVKLRELSY